MTKVINAVAAVWSAIKAYPHGVALALNLGVILAAKFGFEVTPDQLITIASIMSVAVTSYTHKTMVSKSNLTGN